MLRISSALFLAIAIIGALEISATAAPRKSRMTPAEAERQIQVAASNYLKCLTDATVREIKLKTPQQGLVAKAIKSCDRSYGQLEAILTRFARNPKVAKQQARKIKSEALVTLATALAEASTSQQ